MKRVHYTDSYLLVPQHPVTVNLIGGGGTGSQVLTNLARLDVTLRALGHPGLFVTLYDPDTFAYLGMMIKKSTMVFFLWANAKCLHLHF